MSALQIKAGKFYRTRDGQKIGPMERVGSPHYPWRSTKGSGQTGFTESGRFLLCEEDDFDLVAEWQDEPATVEPDLHDQLLDAERRCEATHDAVCTALRVLCEAAGLRVSEGKGYDFPVLFGLIHEWVGQQASFSDPDFAEVAPPTSPDPTDGGYYTTVLVPTEKLGEISYALSDLACWARGFRAALPRNEFGVASEDAPMGTWAVTEINIALKRALEKNA